MIKARSEEESIVKFALAIVVTLTILALACGIYEQILGDSRLQTAFYFSSLAFGFITAVLACIYLVRSNRPLEQFSRNNSRRVLYYVVLWAVTPLIACLPLYVASDLDLFASYLQLVSAMTTTGSIFSPDAAQAGVLLWLRLCEWLGGLITIVGILRLFDQHTRVSEESFLASDLSYDIGARNTSWLTIRNIAIYILSTIAIIFSLSLAGETDADAFAFGLSSVATGGLAPTKALGGSSMLIVSAGLLVGAVAMTLNFRPRNFLGARFTRAERDAMSFVLLILFSALAIEIIWLDANNVGDIFKHLGETLFATLSFASTSGIGTSAIRAEFISTPWLLFMLLALIGGGAISTTGGLGWSQISLIVSHSKQEIVRLGHSSEREFSHAVSDALSARSMLPVWANIMAIVLLLVVISISVALSGASFENALLASVGAVTNTGTMLSSALTAPNLEASSIDVLLIIGMLAGRIELILLLAAMFHLYEHVEK